MKGFQDFLPNRSYFVFLLRYEATDMNIYRSALDACVITDLPNVRDYIHKHRERLMEEKRQKMIALENQRQLAVGINQAHHQGQNAAQVAVQNIGHQNVLQPIDIVREINAVNARANNANNNNANNNNTAPNPPPMPMEEDEDNGE